MRQFAHLHLHTCTHTHTRTRKCKCTHTHTTSLSPSPIFANTLPPSHVGGTNQDGKHTKSHLATSVSVALPRLRLRRWRARKKPIPPETRNNLGPKTRRHLLNIFGTFANPFKAIERQQQRRRTTTTTTTTTTTATTITTTTKVKQNDCSWQNRWRRRLEMKIWNEFPELKTNWWSLFMEKLVKFYQNKWKCLKKLLSSLWKTNLRRTFLKKQKNWIFRQLIFYSIWRILFSVQQPSYHFLW